LECLPENYNSNFYASHLRQWPDLALIAEDVSEAPQNHSRLPFSKFSAAQPEPKIIAYVLGKIESRPIVDYENPTYGKEQAETLGHVTSLAVQDDFRRLGLAKAMMTQLHHHLQHQGIKHCGLHVRTSNEAACRLYQNDGYEIAQIIPSYYQDGEDAYFMRKTLPDSCFTSSGQSLLFGNKIWKTGPDELRLPRSHTAPSRNNMQPPGSQHASPELLTGTM
jgi:peptide alpha-N-acetyltransferase